MATKAIQPNTTRAPSAHLTRRTLVTTAAAVPVAATSVLAAAPITDPLVDMEMELNTALAADGDIGDILDRIAETPIITAAGVAVVARCLEPAVGMRDLTMVHSILEWAGRQTGNDESTEQMRMDAAGLTAISDEIVPLVPIAQPIIDPHIEWYQRYRAAVAEFEETEDEDVFEESIKLRNQICYRDAKTLAGVEVQLLMLCDAVRLDPSDAPLNALHNARNTISHLNALEIVRQRDAMLATA
jgi:hypothetical protein